MNINRSWVGGWDIEIEGKMISAQRDSKHHKWIFRNGNGFYAEPFFTISEKKGEAIIEFLKKLSTCRQSKETSKKDILEDSFDKDHNEENLEHRGGENIFESSCRR